MDNRQELLVLFLTIILGAIATSARWVWSSLKKPRSWPISADTFPFEVIKPHSRKVLQQLLGSVGGDENNPLADFNIPYQVREAGRSVRQELEQVLNDKHWLLVLGRTGLGKTREAAELARILNNEGWTILKLINQQWLDMPRQFPVNKIGSRRKLLFFLDDLNQSMYRGQQKPLRGDDLSQLLKIPLQERLLQTLEFYENECRPDEIRVIATARDEESHNPQRPDQPSELEKLELDQYPSLWKRFGIYPLPEPEDQAIVDLLTDLVPRANIQVDPQDYQHYARRNDGTFRNMVENLQMARSRNQPLASIFRPTLQGTWEKRYQDAVDKFAAAPYIYDAIDLLQTVHVTLECFTVEPTAQLIADGNWLHRRWCKRQIHRSLNYLIKNECILMPRDGQIEAKGTQVEANEYIPRLSRLLLQLTDRHPQQILFSLLNFGVKALNLGCDQDALASFNKVLRFVPNLNLVWFVHGLALDGLERYEEAIASFNKAVKLKPDDQYAWNYRGLVLEKLDRREEAVKSYDKVIELKPDDQYAWNFRSLTLISLKHYEEAVKSYDKVIELKPDDYQALYIRSLILISLKRYGEAVTSFDEAIELKPDYYDTWFGRSVALINLGRYEEAATSFDEVIKLKPDDDNALYIRGLTLGSLRRYKEAITSFDKAIELKPDNHEVWYIRGLILVTLKHYKEAIISYDKALEIQPNYANAYYKKACCYALQVNVDPALTNLGYAINLSSDEYRELAKTDSAFDRIRDNGQFQALIHDKNS